MLKSNPINMNSRRSIQIIIESFLRLLNEKEYEKITISEICREAAIVRNTFYAHFKTKEDVIKYYLFDLFKKEFNEFEKKDICTDMTEVYFNVCSSVREFLVLLYKNDLLHLLSDFEQLFTLVDFTEYIDIHCEVSDLATEYAYTVYNAALSNIVKKWIQKGMVETPKQLSDMFHELIV